MSAATMTETQPKPRRPKPATEQAAETDRPASAPEPAPAAALLRAPTVSPCLDPTATEFIAAGRVDRAWLAFDAVQGPHTPDDQEVIQTVRERQAARGRAIEARHSAAKQRVRQLLNACEYEARAANGQAAAVADAALSGAEPPATPDPAPLLHRCAVLRQAMRVIQARLAQDLQRVS